MMADGYGGQSYLPGVVLWARGIVLYLSEHHIKAIDIFNDATTPSSCTSAVISSLYVPCPLLGQHCVIHRLRLVPADAQWGSLSESKMVPTFINVVL